MRPPSLQPIRLETVTDRKGIPFHAGTVLVHLLAAAVFRRQYPALFDSPPSSASTSSSAALPPIPTIYVRCPSPFPQVEAFVTLCACWYSLELEAVEGGMREALQVYVDRRRHSLASANSDSNANGAGSVVGRRGEIKAVLVGTRRNDPHGEHLRPFAPTDAGWPAFMRVHPILDWSYGDVWAFLRSEKLTLGAGGATDVGGKRRGLAWCELYDYGCVPSRPLNPSGVALSCSYLCRARAQLHLARLDAQHVPEPALARDSVRHDRPLSAFFTGRRELDDACGGSGTAAWRVEAGMGVGGRDGGEGWAVSFCALEARTPCRKLMLTCHRAGAACLVIVFQSANPETDELTFSQGNLALEGPRPDSAFPCDNDDDDHDERHAKHERCERQLKLKSGSRGTAGSVGRCVRGDNYGLEASDAERDLDGLGIPSRASFIARRRRNAFSSTHTTC